MNQTFDNEMRSALRDDPISVPETVHQRTEELLASLPERAAEKKVIRFPRTMRRMVSAAACFVFLMMVVLPNTSVAYAEAVAEIPVIGKLVQVFTIRNYDYFDGKHELEADIPNVSDPMHKESGDLINRDVNELTDAVIADFYAVVERHGGEGYGALHISHETLCSTEQWFTLRLTVSESAADSSESVYIYHIDRAAGEYVSFGDLFDGDSREALEQMILADMQAQMTADDNVSYWSEEEEPGFAALDAEQSFYFAENGDLVIVYDEFAVAPGYMGNPEFRIAAEDCAALVAPAYGDLF